MTDGNASSYYSVSSKNGRGLEVVYAFAGKTVAPQELDVLLATRRTDGKPVALVEIMASTLSRNSGFQSLRADVLKASSKPQRFRFKPVGAKWILVRITPMANSRSVTVAEIVVRGQVGPPKTNYQFKESPAKAFAVLVQLRKTVKVTISPDEAALFKDARDGKLDQFTFAEAALMASGVADRRRRRNYLRRIAAMESQARKALADSKGPMQRGERLLRWLHAGPMKAGYRSHQTFVSTVLDDRTYNCVSSATVYNILGRRIGLNLRGIEVPDHAFSILYVGKRHYDVETTSKNGFAPARNPAVLKELQEKKGLRYIPDRNRSKRREIDDLGMAALIYYNRGVTLMKQKKHNDALVSFFCALSLDSEFVSAIKNVLAVLTNWSNGLAKAGHFEDAIRVVSVGLKLAPQDATLNHNHKVYWTNSSLAAIDAGHHDRALRILKRADAAVKGGQFAVMRSRVFIRPGEKLIKQKKWADALVLVATGLKKIDGKAHQDLLHWRNGLYLRWGNAELRQRRFDKATDVLAKGHAVAPKDKKIINNLGYIAQEWSRSVYRKDGFDKALRVAMKLRKRFSKLVGVQKSTVNFVGRVVSNLRFSGKYTEALKAVDKAGALLGDPKQRTRLQASVYDTWARSFWRKKKQYDKGLTIYRQGLKKLPGNRLLTQNAAYVWNLKGMIHIKAKNWDQGIAVYTAGQKEFPKSSTLKTNLRYCEYQKKRAGMKTP